MKAALYARVSTYEKHQDPETQLHALREYCNNAGLEIFREYVDYARARHWIGRKSWAALQKDARLRKFSCVLVFRLDRAFRSVRECLNVVEDWKHMHITFKCVAQGEIDTSTSSGLCFFQMSAAFAELESSVIGERVSAGMARAKAQGKKLGRPSKSIETSKVAEAYKIAGTYSGAARLLSSKGKKCSAGFVQLRLSRAKLI